jgi:hypothetical protein
MKFRIDIDLDDAALRTVSGKPSPHILAAILRDTAGHVEAQGIARLTSTVLRAPGGEPVGRLMVIKDHPDQRDHYDLSTDQALAMLTSRNVSDTDARAMLGHAIDNLEHLGGNGEYFASPFLIRADDDTQTFTIKVV